MRYCLTPEESRTTDPSTSVWVSCRIELCTRERLLRFAPPPPHYPYCFVLFFESSRGQTSRISSFYNATGNSRILTKELQRKGERVSASGVTGVRCKFVFFHRGGGGEANKHMLYYVVWRRACTIILIVCVCNGRMIQYVRMYVCMYVWSSHLAECGSTG